MSKNSLIEKWKNLRMKALSENFPKNIMYFRLYNELTLIVTKMCNLNCLYCYDKTNLPKDWKPGFNKEMTTSQVKNLIEMLKEIGVINIRITGGEPFIRPDIFEILESTEEMNVTICSNLTLLTEEKVEQLSKINFGSLHIHTSIDGIKTHEKYRPPSKVHQILEKINLLREVFGDNIMVSVNTVVNKENVHELLQLYNLLKNYKINRWTISFPRLTGKTRHTFFTLPQIEILVKKIKELLQHYFKDGKPFLLTVGYFYKYEIVELVKKFGKEKVINSYNIVKEKVNFHPCLPLYKIGNMNILSEKSNISM